MTITGAGRRSPIHEDDASSSVRAPTTSSDVEKKPHRLADAQTDMLLVQTAVKRRWTANAGFSASPPTEDVPAGVKSRARAMIDAAPNVFEALAADGQAAAPWTLSVIGPEGAILAGPGTATVKLHRKDAGVFSVARMPRTFHEQLVTRQKNEPLENFEARTKFLARLRNFEGSLEAVLCLCKNWQHQPNTNEILLRGDGGALQALWDAITPTTSAIGDMRSRLESSAGIEKQRPGSMESTHKEAPRLRVQKRIHDLMDARQTEISNRLKAHAPSASEAQTQCARHLAQLDEIAAFMHDATAAQLDKILEAMEADAWDALEVRDPISRPSLPELAPESPKASPDGKVEAEAKSADSAALVKAWTAIDAIRHLWSSSKCSDHLISGFLEMNPSQITTIFGQRKSLPQPQANHHRQRLDMGLDGLVAAIKQGRKVSDFPAYAKTLAPLRTMIGMSCAERENFRKDCTTDDGDSAR